MGMEGLLVWDSVQAESLVVSLRKTFYLLSTHDEDSKSYT